MSSMRRPGTSSRPRSLRIPAPGPTGNTWNTMDRSSAIDHCADWAETLIHARRTVLPKRLASPGPEPAQLERILAAASAAPDHGELVPWRFVVVPHAARPVLATAFADALLERDAAASDDQLAQAREKA